MKTPNRTRLSFKKHLLEILDREEFTCRHELNGHHYVTDDFQSFLRGSLQLISRCRGIKTPTEFNCLVDSVDVSTTTSLDNDSPITHTHRRLWWLGQFTQLQLIAKELYSNTNWDNKDYGASND